MAGITQQSTLEPTAELSCHRTPPRPTARRARRAHPLLAATILLVLALAPGVLLAVLVAMGE